MPHKFKQVFQPILENLNLFDEKNIIFENGFKKSKKSIEVKLCADGTNVARCKKLLNFNFTVLNETQRCKTAKGN